MIRAIMAILLFIGPARASEVLTIERINSSPELEGLSPRSLEFSPNGRRLTFLRPSAENIDVLDLWEFDLNTGAPSLLVAAKSLTAGAISAEEKSRRERMRMNKGGITERHFSNDGTKIAIPAGDTLFLYEFGKPVEKIPPRKAPAIDVKFSPKDNFLSYVRAQNLQLYDLRAKREIPVTTIGKGEVSFGTAEFVAQEEMDRFTGYWWSDDEKYLALARVDETAVKQVDRYDIDASGVTVHKERYPQAGTANAKVRLGIVALTDARKAPDKVQWIEFDSKQNDFYLADAKWTPDGRLAFEIQSRDQKKLDLWVYDPSTRKARKFLTEADPHWVDLNHQWKWLKKRPEMLWLSERSGHSHLYLYDRSGALVRPLTSGDWDVDEVVGVDEDLGLAYFTGTRKSVLEKHLYRVSLAGGDVEVLTSEEGWDEIAMSDDAKFFVRRFSKPLAPPSVFLHTAPGELISTLSDNSVREGHPLFPYRDALIEPEYGSFKGPSGAELFFRLLKPRNFDAKKKYPMIVVGYGGPHVQVVQKGWGGRHELFAQVLASKGFLVASIDNRGSSRRGKEFSDANYRAFGSVEVEDQVAGVRHLLAKGFIDKDRVGFYGWSYGGYLSLMLAFQAPDVFRANVSGAPVTDFALYDTHYTERYLGDPKVEKEVYKRASVLERAPSATHLLIAHGMADDNVLFTNSTLLFKKLQTAGILYESVVYPGARHGLYGRDNQIHIGRTVVDYFERRLKP